MDAIEKLKQGFSNFKNGYHKDHQAVYQDLIESGQKPKVAVIACSDSRVDPAIVLQMEPGDVFMIRNIANLVPPYEDNGSYHGTSAALEYAVQHLHVEHIIVLGHAHCGGIKTLFDGNKERVTGHFFVPPWMSMVEPAYLRVIATMPDASDREKHQACEQGAVLVSLENLMTFACIRKKVTEGSLRLHGWFIDIKTGELSCYHADSHTFEALG
ncbi:MAG: carbonic anhydrase [Rhodospirillales bacterium]|nr:carbonic anhydrase [Rhodospirillales bacterium]